MRGSYFPRPSKSRQAGSALPAVVREYDVFRFRHEPGEAAPSELRDGLPEASRLAILVCGQESDLAAIEARRIGERIYRLLPPWCNRAVRGDDFDENDQRLLRPEIGEDCIRKVLVGFDLQADRTGDAVVAENDFVAALAQPEHRRGFQKALGEHLDDALRDERARPGGKLPCLAIRKRDEHARSGRSRARPNDRYSRQRAFG